MNASQTQELPINDSMSDRRPPGKAKVAVSLDYLDDVVIFWRTPEKQIEHICQVLTLLRDRGLKLNFKKFKLLINHIDYLRHVIRPWFVEGSRRKIDVLPGLEHPTNMTEL